MIFFDRLYRGIRIPHTRCRNLCQNEANIDGSGYGRYNARCSMCEIALNTNDLRCFCCKQVLRRRKSVTVAKKEVMRLDG
jgi:hypothetical protein